MAEDTMVEDADSTAWVDSCRWDDIPESYWRFRFRETSDDEESSAAESPDEESPVEEPSDEESPEEDDDTADLFLDRLDVSAEDLLLDCMAAADKVNININFVKIHAKSSHFACKIG